MRIKNSRRIFDKPGGDPSLPDRVAYLENNEYKVTYWEEISTDSGTITKPTGSTIILDSFMSGVDALVETIVNGQPSGLSPVTGGGAYVTVSSFDTSGNYTLSGTPSATPVALLYILTIPADQYQNLDLDYVITSEPANPITQTITNGDTTHSPSSDAVFDALATKADKSNTVLSTYLEIPEQSKPATPTNATRIYADSSNRLSWIGENGYARTFDGTGNTADRIYILPYASGTIALTTNAMGRKLFAYDNTTYTYTGATGNTILRTIYIPGNTVGANSIVELFANFTKTGTAGNPAYAVYVGTDPSALLGGALVQYIQPGATSLQSGIWVRLVNKNSLSSQITKGISQVANSLLISQTIPTPSRSFDFSNDLYIHIYATAANTSDTQGITDYQCYIDNIS